MVIGPLIGRETELSQIDAFLADARRSRGSALALRGAGGIGKTSLLRTAAAHAALAGMRVLSVTGVPAEAHLPFAGLRQLLTPLLDQAGSRTAAARDLILAAAGELPDAQAAQPYRTALAALQLLSAAAGRQSVLVVADDAQWLDQQSWEALAFIARRLGADPVGLLIAVRDGEEAGSRLSSGRLTQLSVEPLANAAASTLLDRVAPELPAALRSRILQEAAGNPLALVELPAAAARLDATEPLPAELPLTARLEQNYSLIAAALPAGARSLLLVGALDGSGLLDEILAAGALVTGRSMTTEDFQPAVSAGLVSIDNPMLQFFHPLVRSAIRQAATVTDLVAAHSALADVIPGQDDRRVWHRAAAATGKDENVARSLADAAGRARRRGAVAAARAAWEKSALLSEDASERAKRQLWAAMAAAQMGDSAGAVRLLDSIRSEDLRGPDNAQLLWARTAVTGEAWSGAARLVTLADIADRMRQEGDAELALDYLVSFSLICFWTNPDLQTRQHIIAVVERLGISPLDPRLVSVLAMIAPLERGAIALERMARLLREPDTRPDVLHVLGASASAVGDFATSSVFLASAIAAYRRMGQMGSLSQALDFQAWTAGQLGDLRLALTAADEARALALETGQPLWAQSAHLAAGVAEALRGNPSVALAIADEEEQAILGEGLRPFLAWVQLIRGLAQLAAGRHAEAYDELYRIYDPADTAHHPYVRFWILGHLAEAGMAGGHRAQLRAVLAEAADVAAGSKWPVVTAGLAYASALLADDAQADGAYQAALSSGLQDWPFERARIRLAYGAWLRRQRRPADSRQHLRAAQQTFEALGYAPWAERARRELRASGESVRPSGDRTGQLTPQELQIAQLAASGLSNRAIAEQLYLSPRTITTHLYRIYPKIGAGNRRDLGRLLAHANPETNPKLANYVRLRTRSAGFRA